MSMVRDVLGLTDRSSGTPSSTPTTTSVHQSQRGATPTGAATPSTAHKDVPRELQQLRSEFNWNPVPMAPTPPLGGGFKAKRIKAVSWKLLPIRSSARTAHTGKLTDDLDLKHWVKIHNLPDYMFARFNKSIKLLEYSNEEYEQYLQDPNWSRAETDRLMDLAKTYDLRFIIMEDRYNALSKIEREKAVQSTLPPVDEEKIRLAGKMLQTKLHAGESKEEAEERIKANENNVSIGPNILLHLPPTSSDGSTGSQMSVDPSTVTPIVGDGVIVQTTTSSSTNSSSNPSTSSTATSAPSSLSPSSTSSSPSSVALSNIPGVFDERTVEQLKSRFYFIQQTLTQLRNASDPDLKKTNPLFTHPYDSAHEVLRKAQLDRLYQRKSDEIDEMAQIVLEHREITAQIKKIKKAEKESRDVLRGYKPAPKRAGSAAVTGAAGALPPSMTPISNKKKSTTKGAVMRSSPIPLGELAPIPSVCDASNILPVRPNGSVFLRSSQLSQTLNINPNTKQGKYLETELNQLNIRRPKDLPVPTEVVCDLYDKLRVNILTLLNLQQYVRDRETMRDDLKAHAVHLPAASPSIQRQSSVDSSYGTPSAASSSTGAAASNVQGSSKKKQEKRRLEGAEQEQDDKRPRTKK